MFADFTEAHNKFDEHLTDAEQKRASTAYWIDAVSKATQFRSSVSGWLQANRVQGESGAEFDDLVDDVDVNDSVIHHEACPRLAPRYVP